MMNSSSNEGIQLAMEFLLENFVVERRRDTEAFREIIYNEKTIREFMAENFGFQLKVDSETAKLEKMPYSAREWMGVGVFNDELDYVFLMAILGVLESKAADDGFLLSEIIEEVKTFLTDIYHVQWKLNHNRQSFVRALTYAENTKLIKILDGNVTDFNNSEDEEVLYQTTSLIRYVFRNLSKPIEMFTRREELIHDGLDVENSKQTFMRKLYFEPVVHKEELSESELLFIEEEENYQTIQQSIEHYTPFQLERSYNCLYLVHRERKRNLEQHPSFKGESFIVSHVAKVLTQRLDSLESKPFGLYTLSYKEFDILLKETYQNYAIGWSSKMRELSFTKYKEMVINYTTEWKLATYDETTMEITFYPPFIRTTGEYEEDLREYIDNQISEEDTKEYAKS